MVKYTTYTTIMMCWLVLASGCASDTSHAVAVPTGECTERTGSQDDVQLNIISTIVEQGALYAALAHLDAMDKEAQKTPPVRYLRADILRRTGRSDEARQIYNGLLKTCLAGAGYHGLGLIAAKDGDLKLAMNDLQTARRMLPTDPKVRNDYGYVLLLDNEREAARREFITAMELGDNDGRAAMNYLTLLFVEGKREEAMQFAERTHVPKEKVDFAQQRAAKLAVSGARDQAARADHVSDDQQEKQNTEVKP